MEIWIGRDGERHGPYKESDVRDWLRSGQVSRDDLAWYEGLADWQPLSVLFPDALAHAPSITADPVAAAPLPQTTTVALEDYAGFWQRFGAWVIDLLVLTIPFVIAFYAMNGMDAVRHLLAQMPAGGGTPGDPAVAEAISDYVVAVRPASIAAVFIGFVYYVLFECSNWQATPGKRALGLRVTDINGGRLSLARSAGRNAVRLTNLIFGLIPVICYLAIAWTQRKQGLHDLIVGTLVLNGRASQFSDKPKASTSSGSFSA